MPYQLILNTCPDFSVSKTLASKIIENELAACVNILPSLTSVYRWQGKIETAQEHLLLIKVPRRLSKNRESILRQPPSSQYTNIEQFINAHHPYDTPEIIAFSIENGLPAYLQWIDSCATLK